MSENDSAQRPGPELPETGRPGTEPSPGERRRPGGEDELHARLLAYEGRPAAISAHGKDPVNEPMIRHWCEALGHPVPPDGSAPATMLQVWTMTGLAERGEAGTRAGAYDALLGALDEAGYTSVVATDCEQEYPRTLRPGEAITFDALIESVSPRKSTKLGTGYFVTTRMDITAADELVGTHRFRILKYRPPHTGTGAPRNAAEGRHRNATKEPPQGAPEDAPQGAPQDVAESPPAARRPRPVVNRDNAGFWEGVSAHELRVQRCDVCGTARFPWLPGCNACGSQEWTAFTAAGRGTVYSYVVMHHPAFPAFDPPYAVALVELEEGVRMVSNITGVPCEKVRIGMPVELEFLRVDDELELPVFRAEAA